MNEQDQLRYIQRYGERLRNFGHDPRTLGWMKGRQEIRFEALTSFVPWRRVGSILDVGCGFGDLHRWLSGRGYAGRYTGIDFNPDLIEVGRRVYPDADLRLQDVCTFQAEHSYDLVLASGIFNAPLTYEKHYANIEQTLRCMFSLCRVAATADFLSDYVDYRDATVHYSSPEHVFSLCKRMTRRVALAHQYLPFEFAICLFKDETLSESGTFSSLNPD